MPRLNARLCYVGAAALVALVLPAVHSSNCGGNSAALYEVHRYWKFVDDVAAANTAGEFDVTKANAMERRQLAELTQGSWIDPGRYLVSTLPYRSETESRRLLIVCDQAFRNVPRHAASPTHAAAYSDGTVELLSEEEFAALDRSGFMSLDRLASEPERR